MLRDRKRFGAVVDICFRKAGLCRVFNDARLLRKRYGDDLASRIATRMAVLKAAKHLGLVPQRPPIGLCKHDGSPTTFTVDVDPPRRLRFVAIGTRQQRGQRLALDRVRSIEIVAFE